MLALVFLAESHDRQSGSPFLDTLSGLDFFQISSMSSEKRSSPRGTSRNGTVPVKESVLVTHGQPMHHTSSYLQRDDHAHTI